MHNTIIHPHETIPAQILSEDEKGTSHDSGWGGGGGGGGGDELAYCFVCNGLKKNILENPGIDPGTSHMLSEHSTT